MHRRRKLAHLRVPAVAAAILSAASIVPAAAQARFGDRTLRKGDSGGDVRGLQRNLNRAGYRTAVDGQFGPHTLKRVRAFEGNERLRVDGKVTRRNAKVLKRAARRARNGEEEPPGGAGTDPGSEEVAGSEAVLTDDGLAIPPADAPEEVKEAIEAGNEIAEKPYKYGGGHGRLKDSGYDCSGSVSYALRKAGLMDGSMPSGAMMSWGKRRRGDWITVYANRGHAYMVIAGLRFDTSARKRTGTRWSDTGRSRHGYRARHPDGF